MNHPGHQEETRHTDVTMIRAFHLADVDIANGFCGVNAIFEAMESLSIRNTRHLYLAALSIPLALVFGGLE